ncbi:hypothetical protein TVAG_072420 [Trichomonas vaginalis G3]|uniref:Uncharacterized protein n=1 Tax=Trichomonas vaginalis (strain ATCC PRA-98 / G3) TaxID=412133 RepID=A2EUC6_TRIV3|nr:ATPase activity, coupled to transmembrane movement of substances [Trichomonas vaginalis G3]EAY03750.1 hypothetical protein TVAG_072420 [Trichomonas vaginalis G3]KAI5532706.1 ATPase activity, coupled to transmembrane movement of substances [Trichomonas vaginalis G3]|eukprot:XP_001315973.1 hypothetical protein [Trichomonas vaginalis G3]
MSLYDEYAIHIPKSPHRRRSAISRRTSSIMELMPEDDEQSQIEHDQKYHRFASQYRAMTYRKWIAIKRSFGPFISNIIVTLVVSCLAILIKYMTAAVYKDTYKTFDFSAYPYKADNLVVIASDYENNYANKPFQKKYIDSIRSLVKTDIGVYPTLHVFSNQTSADDYLYKCRENGTYIAMGFILPDEFSATGGNNISLIWNDTSEADSNTYQSINNSFIGYCIMYRVELATLAKIPDFDDEKFSMIPQETKDAMNKEFTDRNIKKGIDFKVIYTVLTGSSQDSFFAMMSRC